MSFELAKLARAIKRQGQVARVVIASHQGSSPRESGASMLVWQGGQSGTIGGGALELEAARTAFTNAGVRRIPLGPNLGQCCGGAVTLVTEIFETPPEATTCFVRCIEGATEQPLGILRAVANMRNGTDTKLVWQDGWLFEPIQATRQPLWIWGAGHVGRALVDAIAPLDQFDITWVDSALSRFPDTGVKCLPAINIPDAVSSAPKDAHHIILTYSHAFDLEICHRLLHHGFAHAGVIGSGTKWARFRNRLHALGHQNAQISRIRCPIGQTELGKHPQAIAIGVASEVILLSQMGNSEVDLRHEALGKDVAS